jgi:hypothetical protein
MELAGYLLVGDDAVGDDAPLARIADHVLPVGERKLLILGGDNELNLTKCGVFS